MGEIDQQHLATGRVARRLAPIDEDIQRDQDENGRQIDGIERDIAAGGAFPSAAPRRISAWERRTP